MQKPDTQKSTGLDVDGDLDINAGGQKGWDMKNKGLGKCFIRFGDIGCTHTQQDGHTCELVVRLQILINVCGRKALQIAQQTQRKQEAGMISLGSVWLLIENPSLKMVFRERNDVS